MRTDRPSQTVAPNQFVRRLACWLLMFCWIVLALGCAEQDEFLEALPTAGDVNITVPGQDAQALSLGETSDYYRMTRNVSRGVNGGIGGVFLLIERIVQSPASVREENFRQWGPSEPLGLGFGRLAKTPQLRVNQEGIVAALWQGVGTNGYNDLWVATRDLSGGGGWTPAYRLTDNADYRVVLQPAGMSSSTFEQSLPERLRHQAAVGHDSNGTPIWGLWHTLPEQATGGLWTTPSDLASFMIEVWRSYHGEAETLLPQPLARLMLTRQIEDFGLGFSLPSAGVARFQHGGGNAGYRCHAVLSVGGGEGFVTMTNGDAGEEVIWELFDMIARAYGWMA